MPGSRTNISRKRQHIDTATDREPPEKHIGYLAERQGKLSWSIETESDREGHHAEYGSKEQNHIDKEVCLVLFVPSGFNGKRICYQRSENNCV